MNGSQPPDRTDRRPNVIATDGRSWRFAATRRPAGRRRTSLDLASRAAWLLLGDGRPTLGISRPG